jgi:hypothetical protein
MPLADPFRLAVLRSLPLGQDCLAPLALSLGGSSMLRPALLDKLLLLGGPIEVSRLGQSAHIQRVAKRSQLVLRFIADQGHDTRSLLVY